MRASRSDRPERPRGDDREARRRHAYTIAGGRVEVLVARHAGYCYGVERALQVAEEARGTVEGRIYTLGPLIHNPAVVERLAGLGVAPVDDLAEVRSGTVIVRTHGVPADVLAEARDRGLDVIDATCPFVNVAQRKAQALREQRYLPLILGERDHPEVAGLLAYAGPDAVVVEEAAEVPLTAIDGHRVGIVVQTTQTRANLGRLVAVVVPVARETLVFNTICDATEKRQVAARELAAAVDAVIVVGGRNSANTRRLAALCQAIEPRTYHVERAAELEAAWFLGCRRIGVTAGASTPDEEIDVIVARLAELLGV